MKREKNQNILHSSWWMRQLNIWNSDFQKSINKSFFKYYYRRSSTHRIIVCRCNNSNLSTKFKKLNKIKDLPDIKDCHVLAAAIKINADIIVTNNIKDFPNEYLSSFGIMAKTADDFLTDNIDLNQEQALGAFKEIEFNQFFIN